jgi:hypothetical protein
MPNDKEIILKSLNEAREEINTAAIKAAAENWLLAYEAIETARVALNEAAWRASSQRQAQRKLERGGIANGLSTTA